MCENVNENNENSGILMYMKQAKISVALNNGVIINERMKRKRNGGGNKHGVALYWRGIGGHQRKQQPLAA